MSGLSAPIVLVTFKPEGVHTNQAHPEPKAVRPEGREGGRMGGVEIVRLCA